MRRKSARNFRHAPQDFFGDFRCSCAGLLVQSSPLSPFLMHTRRLIAGLGLGVLFLTACQKQPVRRETILGSETMEVVMPTGRTIEHPVHGKEVWFGIGPVSGVAPTRANGAAQIHVFEDGTSSATVTLNIEPAPTGSRYVAWLQKPGTSERIRLDILQNPLRDVRHAATVEIDKDVRSYLDAVVTLERKSGPSETDPVRAIGTVKHQDR